MRVQFRDDSLEDLRDVSKHAELRIVSESGEWISLTMLDGVAYISGSRSIVIHPRSGNVVTVRPERFDER